MALRILTAGESHGEGVLAVVDGFPSGLTVDTAAIDRDLIRRQSGHGRSRRMVLECDRVHVASGVRKGRTMGGPVTLVVKNKDNRLERTPELTAPRPGHADLAGCLKYDVGIREVLERSSARETAARVAAGSLCRQLLARVGIDVLSHVASLGSERAAVPEKLTPAMLRRADRSPVRMLDPKAEKRALLLIDRTRRAGDTLGGVFEIHAFNVPLGLGSHTQWDRKLDGRLAQALMSIQAIKSVEVGLGVESAERLGSKVHDEIRYTSGRFERSGGFHRPTNRAGGIEGGMSNGMPIVCRAAMKPIPTLMRPIRSVDIETHRPCRATVERSDVTAVPAASVVGECVVATVLADALLETFAADTVRDLDDRLRRYIRRLNR